MIRNAFFAVLALVMTAGTFGGTTGVLNAQIEPVETARIA
jgi:hypothetical protein